MGGGGWEEQLQLSEDQACVEVDVPPDGEDGDAAVGGAEGGDVWAGHGYWLYLESC